MEPGQLTNMANINKGLLFMVKMWLVVTNWVCSLSELFRDVCSFCNTSAVKPVKKFKKERKLKLTFSHKTSYLLYHKYTKCTRLNLFPHPDGTGEKSQRIT